MDVEVRRASLDDLAFIVEANLAMALETEQKALSMERLEAGVRRGLQDPSRAVYRVAMQEGVAAGTLMVTTEWSDWRDRWFWWIQSVYVSPPFRRRGLYRALHASVIEDARACGDVCGVRLYVDRENHGAIDTYTSLGLRRGNYELMEREI